MLEYHFESNTIRCNTIPCILWCYFQSDFQPYFKMPDCGAPFSYWYIKFETADESLTNQDWDRSKTVVGNKVL